MKKLISMTDFVLEQEKEFNNGSIGFKEFTNNICNYANFLKQPLELWMFVPCDNNDNFLSEKYSAKENTENKSFTKLSNEYQQAKERCLFEGLFLCDDEFIRAEDSYILFSVKSIGKETIEDMIYYDVNLTQTAIKQIGL